MTTSVAFPPKCDAFSHSSCQRNLGIPAKVHVYSELTNQKHLLVIRKWHVQELEADKPQWQA